MKQVLATAILIASTITTSFAASTAPMPLKGSHYLSQAKVSLALARRTALAKEHGAIVDQELEKENGALRYSFDIKIGAVVHEVGVDARSCKIVEDSIDNGND